ncbi:D-amino acid dehydrogenase [Pseudomonas sp. NPDC007930]|uniref:D-amino acid dehydrogenase n=1 Tax=Pseudomonas sp. NPDC007930 TaxID=3364417 RepID=UPI0036E77617
MAATLVIGAGVIGATTAYYLAQAGETVTVLDAQPEAGLDTSFANGGLLAANSALPWSSPGTPRQLFKWMGNEQAPLLLRPAAIPSLSGWGLKFLANCRAPKYLATAADLTGFAQRSLALMDVLLARQPLAFDAGSGGFLEIFKGPGAMQAAEGFAHMLRGMGASVRALSAAHCVELEPTLAPIEAQIATGLWLENDRWGDARLFTQAIAQAAQRLGARFRFNTPVQRLQVQGGKVQGVWAGGELIEAARVVVCAGALSQRLLAQAGVALPVAPVKGYSLTLAVADVGFAPQRPIVDDHEHICVTPLGDRLRVAGTVEFAGFDRSLRPGRVANLKQALSNLYPQLRMPERIDAWCGLRPMSADGKPFIDRTPVQGLVVNTGHGALGWTLACASAEATCAVLRGEAGPPAFRLGRRIW